MTNAATWTWALTGLLVVSPPLAALACDFSDSESVYEVLGTSGGHQTPELSLPRNVAFVFYARAPGPPQLIAAGTGAPVELDLLGVEPELNHFGLQTPHAPLEPGVMYLYDGFGPFTVADYIDDAAPRPPRIVTTTFFESEHNGLCGGSSCGDSVSVTAQVEPGSDDHTPSAALTYALYLGPSAKAALITTQPERFMIADQSGQFVLRADEGWTEADMFLSISALDLAGNESARSEPILVHSASSGCRVASRTNLSSFIWVIAAMLWHATRRRKTTAVTALVKGRRLGRRTR